jgi:hypothetical protein
MWQKVLIAAAIAALVEIAKRDLYGDYNWPRPTRARRNGVPKNQSGASARSFLPDTDWSSEWSDPFPVASEPS